MKLTTLTISIFTSEVCPFKSSQDDKICYRLPCQHHYHILRPRCGEVSIPDGGLQDDHHNSAGETALEEDSQRLLYFLLWYKIYTVIICRPVIITENGYWYVGDDAIDGGGWIKSEMSGLINLSRSGWKYHDGTDWVLDNTLLFLPGGPGKQL